MKKQDDLYREPSVFVAVDHVPLEPVRTSLNATRLCTKQNDSYPPSPCAKRQSVWNLHVYSRAILGVLDGLMQRRTCGQTNSKTGRYGNDRGKTRDITRSNRVCAHSHDAVSRSGRERGQPKYVCYIMPPNSLSFSLPLLGQSTSCGHFANFLPPPPALLS